MSSLATNGAGPSRAGQALLSEWVHRRRRYFIGIIAGAAIGVLLACTMSPKYAARTVLAPAESNTGVGNGLGNQLGGIANVIGIDSGSHPFRDANFATLNSRMLAEQLIEGEGLAHDFFPRKWDAQRQAWLGKPPDPDSIYKVFQSHLGIKEDRRTGIVTCTFRWKDPQKAAHWLQRLTQLLNDYVREKDISDAKRNLAYLEQELQQQSFVDFRQSLITLMEEQHKRIMMAQGNDEYAYKVIDPPFVPTRPYSPNKPLIVLLFTALGLAVPAFRSLRQRYRQAPRAP